jgi:ATP phosphoribosyltransferase regulatory subunit HisZ
VSSDRDQDHRPRRSVDPLAVDLEHGLAGDHDVELLLAARPVAGFVVRLDQLVARLRRRVGVDAKPGDAERAAHRPPERARDGDAIELVQVGNVEGPGHGGHYHRPSTSSSLARRDRLIP